MDPSIPRFARSSWSSAGRITSDRRLPSHDQRSFRLHDRSQSYVRVNLFFLSFSSSILLYPSIHHIFWGGFCRLWVILLPFSYPHRPKKTLRVLFKLMTIPSPAPIIATPPHSTSPATALPFFPLTSSSPASSSRTPRTYPPKNRPVCSTRRGHISFKSPSGCKTGANRN